MINYDLILIGSYSITIAVIIGLIRFRRIYRTYQPFIFILLAALAHEVISTILIQQHTSNAFSTNILNIVECLLWFWQFRRWDAGPETKWKWPLLTLLIIGIWTLENIIMKRLFVFSSVFSIASSFALIFLAINQVNRLIIQEKKNLLKNSRFLICTGVLIFFTYKIMVESFYVMKLDQSTVFLSNIFNILVFVNLFVNLLFALATLWIPTRQRFSLPS